MCTDGCLRLAWSELGVVEPYLRNEGMEKKMEATGIIGIYRVEGI